MKNKPIRIIFDASPLIINKTGIAYYIERMAVELARQYPSEVELVGFYYNFLGRRNSAHMPTLPNLRYHEIKYIPSKIVYQLRRWHIEIPVEILAHTKADFLLFPNILGYPSMFKTPSAPVIHDLTYLDLPQYVSAKLRRDLERFIPVAIKRSSFVMTVSDFSRHKISKVYHIPLDDILVTPVPPAPSKFHSAQEQKDTLAKLRITNPFILFVGTIEPRKNITKLIKAYMLLPSDMRAQYTLVIAGRIGWNCEEEEALLKSAVEQGYDVRHLGYVDDDTREILYQSATLFSTASHYEGFGMPILEAMSYGIPCAVSDIAVFHEVAGDTAVYFNQDEPSDIAAHLKSLLSSPSQLETRGKAAKIHTQSFSWETVAVSIYNKIKRTLDELKH